MLIDWSGIDLLYYIFKKILKAQQKQEQGGNSSKKSVKKNVKRDDGEDNAEEFVDPETPLGEKKRMSKQMAKEYNPSSVEKS